MFTQLMKLGYSFVYDESGQGVVEYAGVMAIGAFLVFYAYSQIGTVEGAITSVYGKVVSTMAQI